MLVRWLGGWSVTLCSSALEQATDKFYTVLGRGQIAYEDSTIKNPDISSQESGIFFIGQKGHIQIFCLF